MLIVTQVAPYADGPAGVHGVLGPGRHSPAGAGDHARPRPHRRHRRRRHLARSPGRHPRPRPLHHRRDAVVPRPEGSHLQLLATRAACASSASIPPPTPTTSGPSTAPCSAPASTVIPGPRTSTSTSSTTPTPPPPTSSPTIASQWHWRDEIYLFADLRPDAHVILRLATDQVDLTAPGGRTPECGFPLAWTVRGRQAARTFYTRARPLPRSLGVARPTCDTSQEASPG